MTTKTHAVFDGAQDLNQLNRLCLDLLSQQKSTWPDCSQGYASLAHAREREIRCNGFSVRVQHNPGRMRSSLADVRETAIQERPCFLCTSNIPEAQVGVLYRQEYLILCNPMPVFSSHFTVCRVEHRPQAIAGNVTALLQLMTDLGDAWAVLYNGPRCGASAPDHLHFQVVPSGQMPIEREILEKESLTPAVASGGVEFFRVSGLGREVMVLRGKDPAACADVFQRFLTALQGALGSCREEPMLNIGGSRVGETFRLIIFPRRKHRPDAFYAEGEDRLLLSPAIAEMGGILVTPLERDFQLLNATVVEKVYREVSLDRETVDRALRAMGERPGPSNGE